MEPMTMLAIGSAVAGGLSSIFGGKAQGAAIRQQNEQAVRNWIQGNSQITMNNARQQFQSAYQYEQQLQRNNAIAKAAYAYQYDAKDFLNQQTSFQQTELAKQMSSQKSSLMNAVLSRGVSSQSGMYGALAAMQAISGLKNAVQLEKNRLQQAKNIDTQTSNMLSQQTQNIFMPNIQLYNEAPILGDASMAEAGGMISGLVQIGGGILGAGLSMGSTPSPASPSISAPAAGYSTGAPATISTTPLNYSNIPQTPGSVQGNLAFT